MRRWFDALAAVFDARQDELNALDAAVGDGDHGTTMARGFEAARLATLNLEADVSATLQAGGRALLKAGGATGPLFGTMFMEAGRAVADRSPLAQCDVAEMLVAASAAVQRVGRARPGQKTLIDALQPAAEAARVTAQSGGRLASVVAAAAGAARDGAEGTKVLTAHHGRARFLGERAVGHADPGAMSVWLMLDTLRGVLREGSAE